MQKYSTGNIQGTVFSTVLFVQQIRTLNARLTQSLANGTARRNSKNAQTTGLSHLYFYSMNSVTVH